jgi:hypothetical protein
MTGDFQRYFFDAGIRFECTQCGKCCTGAPGVVRVSAGEIAAFAELLAISREEFVRLFVRTVEGVGQSLTERDDGSCIFFESGKCGVYSARPAQCRTYPFWLKNLRNEENWNRAAAECPGIGCGPFHSREDILLSVRESPL